MVVGSSEMRRKRPSTGAVKRLVERFNKLFPKGSKVEWRSINSDGVPYKTVTVQCEAYDSYGNAVCFFNEVRSFCSIEPGFVKYPKARVKGNR